MYTGNSSLLFREKMGRRMEFTDGELILVMDSDSGMILVMYSVSTMILIMDTSVY
jgi:hypothetical protein